MPKKINFSFSGFLQRFHISAMRRGPVLAALAAFITGSVIILITGGQQLFRLEEFEAGKVADRDVVASEPVSFIDEEATQAQRDARIQMVPAVFKYSIPINTDIRRTYDRFVLLSRSLFTEQVSQEEYVLKAGEDFPGLFSEEALLALYQDPDRENSLDTGQRLLEFFLEIGIFAFPQEDLSAYNQDTAELLHNYGERIEREQIGYDQIITKNRLDRAVAQYIEDERLSREFSRGAGNIVSSLLRENVFFSPADTRQRISELNSHLEPVRRYIERGDKIIRKGFVITDEEMEELRALNLSLKRRDPRLVAGQALLLLVLYLLLIFHMGKRIAGRILQPAECYMMTILSAAYFIGASLTNKFVHLGANFPVSILLPTALVVMLPAILLGFPLALVTAMILPLGAFLIEAFDTSSYIVALCSGVVAAHVLQGSKKRMDLVKAGIQIAGANAGAALIVLLFNQAAAVEYAPVIFWAAFNGIASGLLVIGILPVIEQALNAVTPFRLIELSDLNSPILKRLFNAAPGTYSHSIMVANLAETACQEIGANALLARVGSYYHDIGKMEQPGYFVENQTSYNKHMNIAPRLSATVIRSHVKLGIEKARSLGLPEAIVDFIAEHHGNSVITWFYNEALKREGSVNMEDFIYPGSPPRSKESAVVMLADITEAATRTLKKPTVARLEKFIQTLFDAKIDGGQLSQSDLTFRELETIKQAFIKVLAGYYHSRIEYPKLPVETKPQAEEGSAKDKKETPEEKDQT
ncbi:MAG: HDIG domain-containing protein [Spirochaetaceae bacterium]|jgi:putative nucleotidyltransferase with HDIG domain|nr:HDIG domain-containing protein [Spirochaetaceae bacterium]